jgi:hypothetical protein
LSTTLAPGRLEVGGEQAGDDVGGAAGRRRHDDAHALGGLPGSLGAEARGQQGGCRQGGSGGQSRATKKTADHGVPYTLLKNP